MSTTEPRTTLATVAASAGVSVATVSKVLNGRRDVAPATRARVQEMLRTHDYGGRLEWRSTAATPASRAMSAIVVCR